MVVEFRSVRYTNRQQNPMTRGFVALQTIEIDLDDKGVKFDLVEVSVAELGFKDGAPWPEVYARMVEMGLSVCPEQYLKQIRRGDHEKDLIVPVATRVYSNDPDGPEELVIIVVSAEGHTIKWKELSEVLESSLRLCLLRL